MNSSRSDFFQCMACQPPSQLQDLDSIQKHFSSEHSVHDLLSSRATRVVALPFSLSCHSLSCTLPHKCLLCQAKGGEDLPDERLKEHMVEKHGKFFLETWQQFCTFHCRWGGGWNAIRQNSVWTWSILDRGFPKKHLFYPKKNARFRSFIMAIQISNRNCIPLK